MTLRGRGGDKFLAARLACCDKGQACQRHRTARTPRTLHVCFEALQAMRDGDFSRAHGPPTRPEIIGKIGRRLSTTIVAGKRAPHGPRNSTGSGIPLAARARPGSAYGLASAAVPGARWKPPSTRSSTTFCWPTAEVTRRGSPPSPRATSCRRCASTSTGRPLQGRFSLPLGLDRQQNDQAAVGCSPRK